jgi:hypothetical protein
MKQQQHAAWRPSNEAPRAAKRNEDPKKNAQQNFQIANRPRGPPRFLPDPRVAARYGVNPRTLPRWDKTPGLNFPAPIYINNRKYRDEAALDQFDRERAAKSAQDAANARSAVRNQRREPGPGEPAEAASATKS